MFFPFWLTPLLALQKRSEIWPFNGNSLLRCFRLPTFQFLGPPKQQGSNHEQIEMRQYSKFTPTSFNSSYTWNGKKKTRFSTSLSNKFPKWKCVTWLGKDPSFSMGKFNISTGPFSIANCSSHYQRVSLHFPIAFPIVFPFSHGFSQGFHLKWPHFSWRLQRVLLTSCTQTRPGPCRDLRTYGVSCPTILDRGNRFIHRKTIGKW